MGLERSEVIQVVMVNHRCRCIDRADEQHVFNHVLHHTLTNSLELSAGLVSRLERIDVSDQFLDMGGGSTPWAPLLSIFSPQHARANTEVVLKRRHPTVRCYQERWPAAGSSATS